MRLIIVVLCLLKLSQADYSKNYRWVSVDLEIPESHEEFDEVMASNDRSSRMINGYTAVDGMFPWAAVLEVTAAQRNYICSGSVVSVNFIISGQNCIK